MEVDADHRRKAPSFLVDVEREGGEFGIEKLRRITGCNSHILYCLYMSAVVAIVVIDTKACCC